MQAGIDAGVPFEVACGGNGECCTCHLYVPVEELRNTVGYQDPLDLEADALDFASGSTFESRLGCQMKISEGCEGKTFKFIGDENWNGKNMKNF